jgi:hypothetical protein
MTDPSLVQQVIDRCQDALFTGTIRVHTRQAEGEIWLLSGILERVRFGVSLDDEAMRRLLAADKPRVELIPCLPNPNGGFKKGHPMAGSLGSVLPVDLLRFCERHSLTCSIELHSGDSHGEVVYRLGELVSVRCDAGTDRAVAQMLEWSDGRYRFVLPSVEVPMLVPVRLAPPPSIPPSIPPSGEAPVPDSSAWRTASNEALKRKAEEAYAKSLAEDKRLADEAEAEAKRLADEAEAEANRLVYEAEAVRLADEAEANRLADEAQAKREEAARAETTAQKGAGTKLTAQEKRHAKAKRKLEEKKRAAEAEARRRAARAEQRRSQEEARLARAKPSETAATEPSSVVVRVRRVTTEYLHLSVPVTPSMMKKNPEADGSYQIDPDALFAEAVRVAQAPGLAWKSEGEPVVEVHHR